MTKKVLLAVLVLLAIPCAASAHSDTPLSTGITGVGGSQWVLQTNFGLVTSAAADRYVCEEAFAGGDDFQVGVLGLHEWLLFNHDNVIYSADGCNFEIRQDIPRKPAGVAVSDDHSRAAYLINADDPAEAGVWWTDDAAQTVEQASLDVSTLHLSRAVFLDNDRLLVSGYSSDPTTRGEARLVVVGLDDGSTTDIGEMTGLQYPYVFDAAGGWIVWLARDGDGQKIFWGPLDEPARYATAVDSWPTGAVLADDGQSLWLSGVLADAKGVVVGDTAADPVFSQRLVDHSAMCVGRVDRDHYLCARRDREGHDLSRVADDGTVEPVVNFSELAGPRADCPADSDVAKTCPSVWPELAAALDIDPGTPTDDAGANDAGSPADAGSPTPATNDTSGCASTGNHNHHHPATTWLIFAGLTGLALLTRRPQKS